jgi:hypothetical protein
VTASTSGSIVPITLTVNGRIGLTLWAPPWEDDDGEEWQGFLGEGSTILVFPSADALAEYVEEVTEEDRETDLSDHPGWEDVVDWPVSQFRAGPEDHYDLDAVFGWAADKPDPVTVSAVGSVVEMVAEIAECCDDGKLKALVNSTPEYVDVQDEDTSYSGRDGQKAWDDLGDVVASTWERAIARVDKWLEWRGDFSATDLGTETAWDKIGAEPIELVLPDRTVLTIRGERGDDVLFLGSDETIAVFETVAGLARYCREAQEHELTPTTASAPASAPRSTSRRPTPAAAPCCWSSWTSATSTPTRTTSPTPPTPRPGLRRSRSSTVACSSRTDPRRGLGHSSGTSRTR